MVSVEKIRTGLTETGYIPSDQIVFSVFGTVNGRTPLLIEGDPGTGKTSLAKAVGRMLGADLYRVQFYEGLTPEKILYDYDYQKMLLTIESIKSTLSKKLSGKSIDDAIDYVHDIDFYGKDYLIQRPILKALTSEKPAVLLLDEVDKASEEIEYTLLEMLDEFSITIPQYGTITAETENRPMVFLTSNNYRDLSEALKRRCNYLYIERKTEEEMFNILMMSVDADSTLLRRIAACLHKMDDMSLRHHPSIAEGIEWAKQYVALSEETKASTPIENLIYTIAKDKHDIDLIRNQVAKAS